MLLKTVLLLISTVFYNAVFTKAENPGLKVRLSDKAFLSATDAALLIAKKTIMSKHIPDQSGKVDHIQYNVKGMKITQFSYGTPSVNFVPGKGTNFKLLNFHIVVEGQIQLKFWFTRTSSSFQLTASGIGVDFFIFYGDNVKTKKISAQIGACRASVPKPSIHFHGGISWILNKFSGRFTSKIQSAIRKQICSSHSINNINTELAKTINEIPSNIHFMNSFYLNVDLLQPPIINSSLETDLKGEVFWMDQREECPLPVRPMEIFPPSVDLSMITAQISPYLLNSFGYVAHKNKLIRMTITSKNIPNKSILNTTCSNSMCIGRLIPEIGKLYPNQELSVFVESFQMPDVYIKSGNMLLDIYLSVYLYLSTDTPDKPLLILPLTIHTEGKADIVKQIIHFKFSALSVKLGVIRKGLPIKINEKQFQMTINLFVNAFVLPHLNKKGEAGIPISTLIKTDKISNTKFNFGVNSALLMTDVSLNFTEVDNEWNSGILQLIHTTLVMPNYAMSASLFSALQTAFSDDPNRFYYQEDILDNISFDI